MRGKLAWLCKLQPANHAEAKIGAAAAKNLRQRRRNLAGGISSGQATAIVE